MFFILRQAYINFPSAALRVQIFLFLSMLNSDTVSGQTLFSAYF